MTAEPPVRRQRANLTVRGRVTLGAALVMLLAAWLFGLEELYCLAAAAGLLVGYARVWVSTRRWDLQVSRHVHPARVQAGQEARVELAVINRSGRPSPTVDAADPFDGGRRGARFSIAPVAPGETRRSSYRLPSTRRGVHRLGPLELRVQDPFGLAVSTRITAADTSLTVHPRYELVPVHASSSHRADDRRMPQPVLGRGGNEFHTLRGYVPGDDLRHVHWPSSARLDDLVIRQPESLRRGRVTVAADLRTTVADDEMIEAIVSAAAGIAVSSLHAGLQVRVVTTAGYDSGHSEGRTRGAAVLDGLAAATGHRPAGSGAPFRTAGGNDPVVVVTTDRADDADIESAFGLGGPTGTTLVVFETGITAAARMPSGRSRRTVRVPPGGSFSRAWTTWERVTP